MIFSPLIWYRKEKFLEMQGLTDKAFDALKPKLEQWSKENDTPIIRTVDRRVHINVVSFNEYIESGGNSSATKAG